MSEPPASGPEPSPGSDATLISSPKVETPTQSSLSPQERTSTGETRAIPPISTIVDVGSQLGPYKLVDKLGEGGMGAVYKARHVKLGKFVAMKILPQHVMSRPDALARFEREMLAVGALHHPNVVQAHDAGEISGVHYLSMEYVEGQDLQQLVKARGPMSVVNACKAIRQAAQGLAAAHKLGLVHRDIKPSNLFVTKQTGQIKILDMGLALLAQEEVPAALTSTGQCFGTPDYMAPEQWNDAHTCDARADLYSLGCTLFFLLVGHPPYPTETHRTAANKMKGHVIDPIPDLRAARQDVPDGLDAIYRRLMAKAAEDRFASANELADALTPFTRQSPSPGGDRSPLEGSGTKEESTRRSGSDGAVASSGAPVAPAVVTRSVTATLGEAPAEPLAATSTWKPGERSSAQDDPPRGPNRKRLLAAGGAAALVVMLGVIIITITNKDGTKTKIEVPGDSKVEITTDTKSPLAPPGRGAGGEGQTATGWHGWPADAPKPAIAPFNADEARQHQEAWAKYLGVPVEYTNTIGMKFRLIPPGEFTMGSTKEEIAVALKDVPPEDKHWQECIQSEAPQHKVILTQPIYLGVNEVTQAEYEKVMGVNPSHFAPMGMGKEAVAGMDTADHPVETVSWNDAAEFCAKLSKQEKLKPFYFRVGETIEPLDGTGYRLPSEAEWEFACRAGTVTKYWIGDKDEDPVRAGWFGGNSGGRTHAAGELKANPFGLSDIHGNVWEWVQDGWNATFYRQFQVMSAINPNSPFSADSQRMVRGGGWFRPVSVCRSSARHADVLTYRHNAVGFRVSLVAVGSRVGQALKVTGPAIPKSVVTTPSAPASEPIDFAAERKAAEWVIEHQGQVHLRRSGGGVQLFCSRQEDLYGQFQVVHVSLQGASATDAELKEQLARTPFIESIRLENMPQLTIEALAPLRRSTRLTRVEFSNMKGMADEAVAWLNSLPNLQDVGLRWLPITDAEVEMLVANRRLRHLSLPHSDNTSPTVVKALRGLSLESLVVGWLNPDGLEAVGQLESLQSLNTGIAPLDQRGLSSLAALTKLREVDLMSDARLEGRALTELISKIPTLTQVRLHCQAANSDTVLALANAAQLKSMHLDVCEAIPDAIYQRFAEHPNLEEIVLGPHEKTSTVSSPSDAVLESWAKISNLKRCRIHWWNEGKGRQYTTEGIAKFRELRPDVHLNVDQKDYPVSSIIPYSVIQKLDETDPLPKWELLEGSPLPVVAPCAPTLATERQKLWAEFLKRPVIEELDLARMGRAAQRKGEKREGAAPAEPRDGNKNDPSKDGSAGASPSRDDKDGQERAIKNSTILQFALIPPGEFRKIFTRPRDPAIEPDMPVRRFRITKPYAISTTEVTWDQFRQFVEATGYQTEAETNGLGGRGRDFQPDPKINWRTPGWKPDPNEPVTQVTPRDAEAFCAWLTDPDSFKRDPNKREGEKREGEAPAEPRGGDKGDKSKNGSAGASPSRNDARNVIYRLPTEAEWLHACRAGSVHKHVVGPEPSDLADFAWTQEFLDPNPQASPLHLVAQKKPNPFGLHDTLGNVWERTCDFLSPALSPYLPTQNPIGAESPNLKGLAWDASADQVRIESCSPFPGSQSNVGFRVLKQFDGEPLPGPLDRPLVLRAGQPLSVHTLVLRPEKIPGLQSWSIELAGTNAPYAPAIATSPKGDVIATGNGFGKISLSDINGNYQRALLGHEGLIVSLDFSPDGNWLASCERGGGDRGFGGITARVWNVESGALHSVIPFSGWCWDIKFSPSSEQLAVSFYAQYQPSFLIVDLATGRSRKPPDDVGGYGLAWSADGAEIACCHTDHHLRVWDSNSLKVLREVEAPSSQALQWSPGGQWLAMRTPDGKIAIRDAKSLGVTKTFGSDVGTESHAMIWLPDNQRLVVAAAPTNSVFNAATGEQLTRFDRNGYAVAVFDAGKQAVFEQHGRLHFYDTSTGQKLREGKERGATGGWTTLASNGDEVMAIAGKSVRLYDANTGQRLRDIEAVHPYPHEVGVQPSPDSSLTAITAPDPVVVIADSQTGAKRHELSHGQGNVTRVAWSPDGKWLATGATDKLVRVWNVAAGKIEHELAGHTGTIWSLAWSPDGTCIATSADDKSVRLWNPLAGKLVATYDQFAETTHFGDTRNQPLAWTADSHRLWIALNQNIVPLDVATGAFGPLENFSNGNTVSFLNTSPDGQRLLTRDHAGWMFVRGRDAQDRRLLGQHLGQTAQWHPDSRRFLGWEQHHGTVGFDVETNRRLGILFPWLTGDHWLCIGPTGHYRGSPGVEEQIVYVAMLEDGSQRTYTPAEFAKQFGWKNDPEKAELLGK